jgi:hypothetical protein
MQSIGRPEAAPGLPVMDGARLTINPSTDSAFSSRVHELATQADTPEDLETMLRADYPKVRVVRGVTDLVDRWYVYRDGRWTNS